MTVSVAPLLRIEKLTAHYQGIEALHGVSLTVPPGAVIAIIGANGAGKSTLLRAIMGIVSGSASIEFESTPIQKLSPRERSRLGLAFVPEGRGVLGPLTVRENLELGAYLRWTRGNRSEIEADMAFVFDLFPPLRERYHSRASHLSGGQQQMLAIGRAVMARPRLLLLDEPSLGLAPRVTQEIFNALGKLNEAGLTILLVEQKAPLAAKLATRTYVLRTGTIVAELLPSELLTTDLNKYYLGLVS